MLINFIVKFLFLRVSCDYCIVWIREFFGHYGVVRTEHVTSWRVSVATTSDIPLQFTPVVKFGHRGNFTAYYYLVTCSVRVYDVDGTAFF